MSTYTDDDAYLHKWVNQHVFIRKGRYVGHFGSVIGFSNGRIRVQVGNDIVNKLESQLELYDPDLHASTFQSLCDPAAVKPLRSMTKSAPSLIGSRVRILNGKFGGYCGMVSKGGNGYFAVEIETGLSSASIVMKRSSELAVLSQSKAPGEFRNVTVTSGEDVRQAAVILLDLMKQAINV